jgi:hypothetical protein
MQRRCPPTPRRSTRRWRRTEPREAGGPRRAAQPRACAPHRDRFFLQFQARCRARSISSSCSRSRATGASECTITSRMRGAGLPGGDRHRLRTHRSAAATLYALHAILARPRRGGWCRRLQAQAAARWGKHGLVEMWWCRVIRCSPRSIKGLTSGHRAVEPIRAVSGIWGPAYAGTARN